MIIHDNAVCPDCRRSVEREARFEPTFGPPVEVTVSRPHRHQWQGAGAITDAPPDEVMYIAMVCACGEARAVRVDR